MEKRFCPECGTEPIGVNSCNDYLERMIAWDFSDFTRIGRVHHLTVLCYYLQHPSRYSQKGLENAIMILKKVIEEHLSDKELYKEESETFASTGRDWKVRGDSTNHGTYEKQVTWARTVSSVVKYGKEVYPDHVTTWANTIYRDLKKAGVLK